MADNLTDMMAQRKPMPGRPLLGMTVLVVEDSRFACEAVRLLALRSGARIRRADCLQSARRHLQVYRPTVVIIDIGLPDGDGSELIRELAQAVPRVPVILATSGRMEAEADARAAGADDFLLKPFANLAAFQQQVIAAMPVEDQSGCVPFGGLRAVPVEEVCPDRIALRDDFAHVAEELRRRHLTSDHGEPPDVPLNYLAQFLGSLAFSAEDADLARAAQSLARASDCGGGEVDRVVAQVRRLVDARIEAAAMI
ncbi:MAG: response regulator [Celeribacter sp.]|jgi:CheY-like chemotaxis protein